MNVHSAWKKYILLEEIPGYQSGKYEVAVLWVVASCGLAEVYRRFRGACNIGKLLSYYTTEQRRIQLSSIPRHFKQLTCLCVHL
jgi:hypothetical protein